ncbi:MAG: ATP synthase d subunit [Lichina confinis]|nr:MAG: ATP synthase d subunit [Lichina confinis]
MAVGRSAALKVDWAKIGSSLGLRGQTASALQAFKKRNDDARRRLQLLSEQPQEIDFQKYRSLLKEQGVVNEIENHFKTFKPKTYDVERQVRAIEAFEVQAVKDAEQTKEKVSVELKDLEKTLRNIEDARPWEDLTLDDMMKAAPEIEKKTEQMVANGRWMPPGYRETFGDLSVA